MEKKNVGYQILFIFSVSTRNSTCVVLDIEKHSHHPYACAYKYEFLLLNIDFSSFYHILFHR